MRRKYWIGIVVLVALVGSATVGWATTVYWRNNQYQLPGYYQRNVMQAILTDHKRDINTLQATVQGMNQRLTTLEAAVAANTGAIAANASNIAGNANDIAANANDIAANAAGIAANTAGVAANAGDIASLQELLADVLVFSRVETGSISGWDETAYSPLIDDTVTVPSQGILLIWANASGEWDITSPTPSHATVELRVVVDGVDAGAHANTNFWDDADGGGGEASVCVAVPVSAGSHTVAYQARRWFGSAEVFWYDRSIQTLFLPFGDGPLTVMAAGSASPVAPVLQNK